MKIANFPNWKPYVDAIRLAVLQSLLFFDTGQRPTPMNYRFSDRPGDVVLNHNTGKQFLARNDDPLLSIKSMFGGFARYTVGHQREYLVGDPHFLILNKGTPYIIRKQSHDPVESFCLFFTPTMLPTVLRDMTHTDADLLEDFDGVQGRAFGFYETRYALYGATRRRILRMRARSHRSELNDAWLEQEMLFLLEGLLIGQRQVQSLLARLPASKKTTRQELYRRLHYAKDYIDANSHQSLTIAKIASVANLSTYHFIRSFQHLFRVTPHQFVTQCRIDRAKRLLATSTLTVSEIAVAVGYESLSSFTTLFRTNVGCSPLQFRRR